MLSDEMALDGNAAAGTLRELFVHDMTAAITTCAGCGAEHPIGALREYGRSMGMILRCPDCDMAILRMAHARDCVRIDLSGIAFMVIANEPS